MTNQAIRVLLIDDDEEDYILTRELFSLVRTGRYILDWAPSYEEGLRLAELREHDVCLVDFSLGEHSGVDLIRKVREGRLTTPMILLTGQGSHDLDIASMYAGATDYLVKDETSPARLERTLRYAVQLNLERRRAEAELGAYAQQHAAVAEIGQLALTGGDLNHLFGEAVSIVARTLSVEFCEILELLPHHDSLILKAGIGWKDEYRVGHATVGAGTESHAGFTLLANEPVVVEELRDEKRFSAPALLVDHNVRNGMSVIIGGGNGTGPYGVMGAHTASSRRFATDDVNFLRNVSNVLAEAISRQHSEDDRKRAEESLRRSETKFRALFENAIDAVTIADDQGVYVDVNPAACRLLGAPCDQIIGCTMADFTDYGEPEVARQWQEFLINGTMRGVLSMRRADGETREVDVAATANFLPGRHLSILRDVTEHLNLEAQLRQSQKLESIGMLAGGIAHDFNNLLTVISGYSDLTLKKLADEDPLARNLHEVQRAADRAAALTRQLLAFSRRQVLQPKIVDLNAVITVISKMIRRLVGEDMELSILPGADLGRVKADPGQLEQVIMNLVINARDSMPGGGSITVETTNVYLDAEFVRTHSSISAGRHVMLNITDTGQGMDEETSKHIFEPFFTTKEQGKGTGLGLATVYGIIKQSGGTIWVMSKLNEGTSFKIYLPTVEEQISESEVDVPRPESAPGSGTILLAEDDEMVRHLTRDSLKIWGYLVLEAANGREALMVSQQYNGTIDLLLTDVVMPRMSGKELADQLLVLRLGTRVLYMSGFTDHAIVHHGVLDGDTDFIEKPFTPDALALKVGKVLQH